jgi:hypothetical protein
MGSATFTLRRRRARLPKRRECSLKASGCLRLDEERHDFRACRAHPFLQPRYEIFDREGC